MPCLRLIDLEEGSGVILRAVQNKIGHALAIAFLLILAVMRVQELKAALWTVKGIKQITTSRDLVLTWEQKYISQAVDMAIAQRAQMFIGVGVRRV